MIIPETTRFQQLQVMYSLQGNLEEVIMERSVDVYFVRGPKSKEYCDVFPNFFSGIIGPGNAKFQETLMQNPGLSNSYCGGVIIRPAMHHWFQQTEASKAEENRCRGKVPNKCSM